MKLLSTFTEKLNNLLDSMEREYLDYDKREYWMIQSVYEYIEFYALRNRYMNTAIALRLARGLHSGAHRKLTVMRDGETYRLPYVIHPLMVCRMLIDLHINIPDEDEDILLASALCHDMIEDIPFPKHGKELMTKFHLDPAVYETVLTVSKRHDFTIDEEKEFFMNINQNKLAALVKLSDRGNNVEDLYNMTSSKVREYARETRQFFYPMYEYALEHYPDISSSIKVLGDKMMCLTEAAETLVNEYEGHAEEQRNKIEELREEQGKLRAEWKALWQERKEAENYE